MPFKVKSYGTHIYHCHMRGPFPCLVLQVIGCHHVKGKDKVVPVLN